MKKHFIFIFSLLILNFLMAQENRNISLGDLSSKDWNGSRLELLTTQGNVRISFLNEGTVRVRVVKDVFDKTFSYAVVEQPDFQGVQYSENRGYLELKSKKITVLITERPVRISFYSSDGTLLNEDDPSFGTSWIGEEVTTYKTLQPNEKFIGLGAKTGGLNRFGTAYVNFNTDDPKHESWSDPLYTSIPFYMGILNNKVYGIFFDNTWRSRFNFGAANNRFSYFSADGGEMDYYFFHDENIASLLRYYTQLTGRIQLPAYWTLGYQQCRWSYTPDTDVLNVARTFREKKIPADVMYLDIDFMDAYKIFTWHPTNFSNPKKLLSDLKELGFHTTVIVDPGIKVEAGYQAFEEGLKKNMFVMYPDQSPFTAQVWPGWCHFPDFTNPKAREWWGGQFQSYIGLGVEGFWNDMNEIAAWGRQVPSLIEFDWEGKQTSYLEAKNVYGMQMARSTFEGTKKLMNGKRPFVLTRAGYAGMQRYTSLWTGDNQAHDDHMLLGVRLLNSLGLSGIAQVGCDIGGFGGNATPELYSRWISLGAFSPFFRGHTEKNTLRSEPWSYGEIPESIARKFISFHYSMLPYIYSGFRQSAQTGIPLQRSLAIDFTYDEKIYQADYENQYLFGPSLMVAPVSSKQKAVKVYFPEGKWYSIYDDKPYEGKTEQWVEAPLDQLPVFAKAGSLIALQSVTQSTSEQPDETVEIHIYQGIQTDEFLWYEDDGTTYQFENGMFYQRNLHYDQRTQTIRISKTEGNFESKFKQIRLVMHGFEPSLTTIRVNQKTIQRANQKLYLNVLTEGVTEKENYTFTFDNTDNQININW